MGVTGENVAEKHSITREQQDAYALASHQKAAAAQKAGAFQDEMLPVEIPAKKKGEAAGVWIVTRACARMRRWRRCAR